jgi:hypothetical protein
MSKQNVWMTHVMMAAGKTSEGDVGCESPFGFDLNPAHALRSISRGVKNLGRTVGEVGRNLGRGSVSGAFHTVTRAASHSSQDVSKGLASVPVIGTGLHAMYQIDTAPLDFATKVASGKRIDKAAYETMKDQVKAYQDIAPYVQMVVSNVPGIGQGLSGAIGAANALSKGRPITEALIEAAKGAVPGGPIAQAAFSAAVAGIQGKPLDEVALAALPIDEDQKVLLAKGIAVAKDVAAGKPVSEIAYNQAVAMLPPEAQKAMQVGVALAQGQKLQQIAAEGVQTAIPKLAEVGGIQVLHNPVFKAGAKAVAHDPDMEHGYRVALGFLQHKVNPTALMSVRSMLTGAGKQGFDIAASAKVGQIAKPLPTSIPPEQRFGYYLTHGMHGNKPKANEVMLKTVNKHPAIKHGVVAAMAEIKEVNKPTLWHKFLQLIGAEGKTS